MKKRDRKFAAAFHVPPKAKAKWDIAVREAEAAMRRTRYLTRKCYIYIYVKSFILRKSSSMYIYRMRYYVHESLSALKCSYAFFCRIERLQDFARLFPTYTSVKNVETRNPSPRSKQQKRVDDNSSFQKTVSTSKLYFQTIKYCYNMAHMASRIW
jgi:hypothetical protein